MSDSTKKGSGNSGADAEKDEYFKILNLDDPNGVLQEQDPWQLLIAGCDPGPGPDPGDPGKASPSPFPILGNIYGLTDEDLWGK